jgi:hypothetical protein
MRARAAARPRQLTVHEIDRRLVIASTPPRIFMGRSAAATTEVEGA